MRACEGCRRRKIKCDAATTNAWPCAACVRLKLHCVPPTVNYSRSHPGGHISGLERVLDFDSSGSGDEDYGPPTSVPHVYEIGTVPESIPSSNPSYGESLAVFQSPPSYSERPPSQHHRSYDNVTSMPMPPQDVPYHNPSTFQIHSAPPVPVSNNPDTWSHEQFSAAHINDALGELKIDESGIGRVAFDILLIFLLILLKHLTYLNKREH